MKRNKGRPTDRPGETKVTIGVRIGQAARQVWDRLLPKERADLVEKALLRHDYCKEKSE